MTDFLHEKSILIIDDHDSIRMLLGSMLKKKYAVTTKKDGIEGMAWLVKGNIPDLILLDMEMPRLNGTEFLKGIKTSGYFRDIPVVVVSGRESSDDQSYCFELGATEFMQKPFNPLKLKDVISSIFKTEEVVVN